MRTQTMKKLPLGAVTLASCLALLVAGCDTPGGGGGGGGGPQIATKLAFEVQPSTTTTDTLINPAVRVLVQDTHGNTVTSGNPNITVAIGTNPGEGVLSGSWTAYYTQTASNGAATFADLWLDKPGTGYTLIAAADGLAGSTSSPFNVVIGEPVATVTVTPAHEDFSGLFTATASDAAGNVLTGRVFTWTFSGSAVCWDSPQWSNPAFVCGTATGSVTVTATSGGKSGTALLTTEAGADLGGCATCCAVGC